MPANMASPATSGTAEDEVQAAMVEYDANAHAIVADQLELDLELMLDEAIAEPPVATVRSAASELPLTTNKTDSVPGSTKATLAKDRPGTGSVPSGGGSLSARKVDKPRASSSSARRPLTPTASRPPTPPTETRPISRQSSTERAPANKGKREEVPEEEQTPRRQRLSAAQMAESSAGWSQASVVSKSEIKGSGSVALGSGLSNPGAMIPIPSGGSVRLRST